MAVVIGEGINGQVAEREKGKSAVSLSFKAKRTTDGEVEEVKALTQQFYLTLKAQVSALRMAGVDAASFAEIDTLLRKGEQGSWTWADAYEVEQRLVTLYPESMLTCELARRMVEARSALRPELTEWYLEQQRAASDTASRRTLLARLLNDLQWRYTIGESMRSYTKQISARTAHLFISAVLLFIGTMLAVGVVRELSVFEHMAACEWSLVLSAAAAGAWGATFSMLTSLRGRTDSTSFEALKMASNWGILTGRALAGLGGALILYFFIRSGLLNGSMFPSIDDACTVDEKNIALMVVWCFLAGFSEKLVPGLLAKTEEKANAQPANAPAVASPGPGPVGSARPPEPNNPAPGVQQPAAAGTPRLADAGS